MDDTSIFGLAANITRTQASIITNGKSDDVADPDAPIRELCETGACGKDGSFYTLKRQDGRYLATIDLVGGHGFYGAPTFQEALRWILKRLDPTCFVCCEEMTLIIEDEAGQSAGLADCSFCGERSNYGLDQDDWNKKGCAHVLAHSSITPGHTAVFTCAEYVKCDKCGYYTETETDDERCAHCGEDPIDYHGPDCRED